MTNGRPRRRSIFGGFLFILVGTLLLLNNLVAQFGVWDLFARYWPVLLILWGLAKLYDHFVARRTGEIPPPTFSGGEVLLLLFLLFFGAAASGVNWLRLHGEDMDISFGPFGQRYSFSEEVRAPASPDAPITITTDRGDISVHPEETAEIRVVVTKSVAAASESDAQKYVKNVAVVIQRVGEAYEVRPQEHAEGRRSITVNLEVHVPKQAAVTAKTGRGDVRVSGLAKSVVLSAERGDVDIRDVGGDVEAEIRRGDLHIIGAKGNVRITGRGSEIEIADVAGAVSVQGEFSGPIRIKNVAKETHFVSRRTDLTIGPLPGRVELSSGHLELFDATGNVTLLTKNYDIMMENVAGRIRVENRHGDIEVRLSQPPREEVDIQNESGSVELALPPNSTFELFASSRSGEVESEFQDPGLKSLEEENTTKLEGKLGARGPQLRLRTSYGTVRLRKSA